jgi:galactose-1-phosphate uridylyltransferase
MTHDELLDRLKNDNWESYAPYITALRAVVELHKPWIRSKLTGVKNYPLCHTCYDNQGGRVFYPCPTIQAIEKELG